MGPDPIYEGRPLRYLPPPMIRITIKKTLKTKPARALGDRAR